MRKPSPTEMDYRRIGELLWTTKGHAITDKTSFQKELTRYWDGDHVPDNIKEGTWKYLKDHRPILGRDEYKEAGGTNKGWKRDVKRKAKTVVKTPEELKKRGAKKVDLEAYDMPARNKLKRVLAARTVYTYKGKERVVYRDRKGRFASVKKLR